MMKHWTAGPSCESPGGMFLPGRAATSQARLTITPLRIPGRLRLGGGRPPHDGGRSFARSHKRIAAKNRRGRITRLAGAVGFCALATALTARPGQAQNAQRPDVSGVYVCEGDTAVCAGFGPILSIAQSGDELKIRPEKGELVTAKLTSDATMTGSAGWNMHGLISSANTGIILWSNGTTWRKQQTARTGGTS